MVTITIVLTVGYFVIPLFFGISTSTILLKNSTKREVISYICFVVLCALSSESACTTTARENIELADSLLLLGVVISNCT